jgi:hypothetical protein
LVDRGLKTVDLADLLGHPWEDYEVAGYSRIWISHPDWTSLTSEELNFRFEAGLDESFLLVSDVFELRDLEEGEDPDQC